MGLALARIPRRSLDVPRKQWTCGLSAAALIALAWLFGLAAV
jgi:hypothetical protein